MRKIPEILKIESLIEYEFDSKYDFKLNYKTNYSFVRSLCVKDLTVNIKEFVKTKKHFNNFIQVGIGGSALGATAAHEFLNGIYANHKKKKRYFVLDNIDPERLEFILSLDFTDTFFHIVSKSGTTTETVAQLNVIYTKAKEILHENTNEHFVITTTKGSFLYEFAEKEKIKVFCMPEDVGGRYSVFTPVVLLPLAFFDNDIDDFIEGAKTAVRAFRNGWSFPNDFAAFSIGEYKNKKDILVMFVYKDVLYSAADWFRQLWAESLGKNGHGQTLVKALGTTDQHSQLQLYRDGKKDKIVVFVDTISLCDFETGVFEEFEYLSKKTISKIMQAEKEATLKSLREIGINCVNILLKRRDEFLLGAFYISLMIAAAKAGEILNINPFDQPSVEFGKQYAKTLLTEESNV